MDYFEIDGPSKLGGKVCISGAKNSSLPIIAATILSNNKVEINNVPDVADINTLLILLSKLGAEYKFQNNSIEIKADQINNYKADYDIVKMLRASILALGPLLGRFNKCDISLPGGCAIGTRPVDLHLKALECMGAKFVIKEGYISGKAPNGLKGAHFKFPKKTVGGTENAIMAATLAEGITILDNVALEPEIVQLCQFINGSGVKIEGIGTECLKIHGTNGKLLHFSPCSIIPDRIEAGTFLCAAAITNSKITLENVNSDHIFASIQELKKMGFSFEINDSSITIFPSKEISSFNIVTSEYPGFPTDLQAQFMALGIRSNEDSTIEERLFENRFMHVSELNRLGADIIINGNTATIKGERGLSAANVMASDLRASSALVIAALIAKGTTRIDRIYHLDRGYENFEKKLIGLGVNIRRLKCAN